MSERGHPDEDLILAVALGEAPDDADDRVAEHLSNCASCRHVHAALLEGVDLTLPAVPRAAPPPGFEARVLGRLHEARQPVGRRRGGTRGSRWLPAAAAALLGVAAGAAGVQLMTEDPATDFPAVVSAPAVPLVSEDGDDVGAISRTHDEGGRRLVVVVDDDAPAAVYTCRVTLRDGTTHDVGRWPVSGYGESAWVVDEPAPGVRNVELVSETGEVWATAEL